MSTDILMRLTSCVKRDKCSLCHMWVQQEGCKPANGPQQTPTLEFWVSMIENEVLACVYRSLAGLRHSVFGTPY